MGDKTSHGGWPIRQNEMLSFTCISFQPAKNSLLFPTRPLFRGNGKRYVLTFWWRGPFSDKFLYLFLITQDSLLTQAHFMIDYKTAVFPLVFSFVRTKPLDEGRKYKVILEFGNLNFLYLWWRRWWRWQSLLELVENRQEDLDRGIYGKENCWTVQSPLFFRGIFETRTLRSNSHHQFVKASATWGECLNYQVSPSQGTLTGVPAPLGSLHILPRLPSPLTNSQGCKNSSMIIF